jgi:hypothetical protein
MVGISLVVAETGITGCRFSDLLPQQSTGTQIRASLLSPSFPAPGSVSCRPPSENVNLVQVLVEIRLVRGYKLSSFVLLTEEGCLGSIYFPFEQQARFRLLLSWML